MSYFSWIWGKKNENEVKRDYIGNDKNVTPSTTASSESTTTTSATTEPATNTNTTSNRKQSAKNRDKDNKENKDQQENTYKTRKDKTKTKGEQSLQERQLDFVNLILDPPIDHVNLTPKMYGDLVQVKRFENSIFTPKQKIWLNGIVGGTIGYLVANSIFKNNPLVKFRTFMIYGSTFIGAYYLTNKYYKSSDYENDCFLYGRHAYLTQCDVYFSDEVLPYLLERAIHDGKYRVTENGDIINPETSQVVIKNYRGPLKQFFQKFDETTSTPSTKKEINNIKPK